MLLGSATSHRYIPSPIELTDVAVGTIGTNSGAAVFWIDICSNGTDWVAVGYTGNPSNGAIYTTKSSDMVNWTSTFIANFTTGGNPGSDTGSPIAIASNGLVYVIILGGGTTIQPTNVYYKSSNGSTWTSSIGSIAGGLWRGLSANDNLFFLSSTAPFQTAVSLDNAGNSSVGGGTPTGQWDINVYNGTNFILLDRFGSQVPRYSSAANGPWIAATGTTGTEAFRDAIFKPGLVVATSTTTSYYSTDSGVSYSITAGGTPTWVCVASNGDYFLGCNNTTGFGTSFDGLNWTNKGSPKGLVKMSGKGPPIADTGNMFGGVSFTTIITRIIVN